MDTVSIDKVKSIHNRLYEKAITDGSELTKEPDGEEFQKFLAEIEDLLSNLKRLSEEAILLDDYRWLAEAVINWQVVYSSTFNIPKIIDLSMPAKGLIHPSINKALSEVELDELIKQNAYFLALPRIKTTGKYSTDEEIKGDYYYAELFVSLWILRGELRFSKMSSLSYVRLERVWLKEVKQLIAYFNWMDRGSKIEPPYQTVDYFKACEALRDMLVNGRIKDSQSDFLEVKAYIENHYLTDGKIDVKSNVKAANLIRKKAERIAVRMIEMGRKRDDLKNWIEAETYVRMFYENIISAVIADDEEKVRMVLRAFQYNKALENKYHIISAFEAALVIYFVKPDIIQKIWNESEEIIQNRCGFTGIEIFKKITNGEILPEQCRVLLQWSSTECEAKVSSWPDDLDLSEELKDLFRFDGEKIIFKGVMTKPQKEALIESLRKLHLEKEEYTAAIDTLFTESRLVFRDATL